MLMNILLQIQVFISLIIFHLKVKYLGYFYIENNDLFGSKMDQITIKNGTF